MGPEPYEPEEAFDPAEAVIDYRGCRIELRLLGVCGTYRVRRPDGSWRYIQPTVTGPCRQEWVILGPATDDDRPELEAVASADEAKRRVDSLLVGPNPR